MKCEVFECNSNTYRRLSIGPGTSTALCETHYIEFKIVYRKDSISQPTQEGEDMVQNNMEKKGVLEVRLTGVDIPRAGFLADLLQEWVTWTKTYDALLEDVGGINDLYQRTSEAVRKWGRDG